MDGKTTLCEVVHRVPKDMDENGINIITNRSSRHFAWFREFELAFALNRLRCFDVIQKDINAD